MSKKAQNHIHKLKRHTYKTGNSVYMCTLPDCYFKSEVEFMLGKRVICNRCNEPFLMNQYALRLAKPHCPNCHNSNRKEGHGGDRRIIATRRELDPTVIPIVAESTITNLRERLSGGVKTEFRQLFTDEVSDDDTDDIL